jgi:hypothetical protein
MKNLKKAWKIELRKNKKPQEMNENMPNGINSIEENGKCMDVFVRVYL